MDGIKFTANDMLSSVGLVEYLPCGLLAAPAVVVPQLPPCETPVAEVAASHPLGQDWTNLRRLDFRLEFVGTASNNVGVAFGRDLDANGELEPHETRIVVGWECGRYFVEDESRQAVTAINPPLLPDYDRDGKIDADDAAQSVRRTFRFWTNEVYVAEFPFEHYFDKTGNSKHVGKNILANSQYFTVTIPRLLLICLLTTKQSEKGKGLSPISSEALESPS